VGIERFAELEGNGQSEPRARAALAGALLRHDRRLLADYVRFYLKGRLGRAERLQHRHVPQAMTWEGARRTILDPIGASPAGASLELVRRTRESPPPNGSVAERAAQRQAGDESLGELVYALVRAERPDVVIETGVATGVTSAYALAALEDNGSGVLHSVDLPPTAFVATGIVGSRVPAALRHRWRYHWGAARRLLPAVLDQTEGRRIFIHDSDHGYRDMRWELEQAWNAMDPGDWLVADDVDLHDAFVDFAQSRGARPYFVAQRDKSSCTGLVRRT
jgi:predicted O-methyltransferase YrrM